MNFFNKLTDLSWTNEFFKKIIQYFQMLPKCKDSEVSAKQPSLNPTYVCKICAISNYSALCFMSSFLGKKHGNVPNQIGTYNGYT